MKPVSSIKCGEYVITTSPGRTYGVLTAGSEARGFCSEEQERQVQPVAWVLGCF